MKVVFKKSDLSIVPRWTDNIDDKWINPFISETCAIAFRDTVSAKLYDTIANLVEPILLGTQGLQWDFADAYNFNDIVVYAGQYYIANTTVLAGENPPNLNANWTVSEKLNFWSHYMKPYLVYSCYKSFIIWHGKHISQGGIRKHTDNTSFEVDAESLGVLIGDLRSRISVKETQMMNVLNRVNYTFDGVTYQPNEYVNKPNLGVQIWGV